MLDFIYKYRFHFVFGVMFASGIALCASSVLVPVLLPIGAAMIAGALGMMAQSLSRNESNNEIPNNQSSETHAQNTQEHRLSLDSHDVTQNVTINNNGPILYMYQADGHEENIIEHKLSNKLEII